MDKEIKDKLKGTLIVPVGLAIILIPFSILIGWDMITLILFWFVLTPGLTIYLPTKFSRSKNHFVESIMGLIIFYAIIILDKLDISINNCVDKEAQDAVTLNGR